MRIGALSVAMLALGVVVPALAQQSPGSQQQARQQQLARQQVDEWVSKWVEAYNRGDAKAVTAMNDPGACTVNAMAGINCEQKQVEQVVANVIKLGPHFTMNVVEVKPIGQEAALAVGSYRVTFTNNPATSQIEGNWLRVLQRDGNELKSLASSFTPRTPPSPAVATGSTGAQPLSGSSTPPAPGATK